MKILSFTVATLVIILLVLPTFLKGCSYPGTNEEYMNYLASIVLQYQKKHGKVPEGFEIAHRESKIVLPNRGDKNGDPYVYRRVGSKAFFFRGYGRDGKNNLGLGDDTDVYYVETKKVNREEFIQYMEQYMEQSEDKVEAEVMLDGYFGKRLCKVIACGNQ
jgi:hypothetical protein